MERFVRSRGCLSREDNLSPEFMREDGKDETLDEYSVVTDKEVVLLLAQRQQFSRGVGALQDAKRKRN